SVRAPVCSAYNTGVQLIKRQNSEESLSVRKAQESLGAFPFRSDLLPAPLILRVAFGLSWRVEKRPQSRQQFIMAAETQQMVAAWEDGELRMRNEPIHLNGVLRANRVAVTHHDESLGFDHLEFRRRIPFEDFLQLLDLRYQNGPPLRVGRHPVVWLLQHRRSKVGAKALKLLVEFGIVSIFHRSRA